MYATLKALGVPMKSRDPDPTAAPASDGRYQVAVAKWMQPGIRAVLRQSGADRRIDATVDQLTGGGFSRAERAQLEQRALDQIEIGDGRRLSDLQPGVPVLMTPRQREIIDRLMDQMATDELGRRARESYRKAWSDGRLRTH